MGYVPDWQRQSHAKSGGSSKPTTNSSIQSRPIFHAEKAQNSNAKQTPFTRHYADASEGGVDSPADRYNQTDKGLLGGEIKYRQDDDGRKYTATKNPMNGQMEERRYYSVDDVKEGIKNFFGGGKKQEADSYSTAPAPKESSGPAPSTENENRKIDLFKSKDTKPTGVFANPSYTEEARNGKTPDSVKTSVGFDNTDKPTPRKTTLGKAGRKDIPNSSAQSFPLKSDIGDVGTQSFPSKYKEADAAKDPISSEPTVDKSPAGRTRAGTPIKESSTDWSFGPKNTFLTKDRVEKADEAMYAARRSSGGRTRAGTLVK